MKITKLKLLLSTPIFILLSHYLAVFPHEYAHSFMAFILGYKNNPWLLNYGGTSLSNLLLLTHIDENVNYLTIYNAGHGYSVALIAFAGSGIANGFLFALSLYLLKQKNIKTKPYLFYFLFWFNLMNLGNFYDYVPIRTFALHGDVYVFVTGLNISPWWVFIAMGSLVVYLIWNFFTKTLISTYKTLKINSPAIKASLMITSVFILFGFFGGVIHIFNSSTPIDNITGFLSLMSLLMIPVVIVTGWSNIYTKRKLK